MKFLSSLSHFTDFTEMFRKNFETALLIQQPLRNISLSYLYTYIDRISDVHVDQLSESCPKQ